MYLLTQGNQVESLADQLLEQLAAPRDNPLASPWVLVPHAEMGQWLARRMARRHGCSANVSFVLAATALWDLMHRANPAIPRHNGYRPEVLAARIFAELGALPDQARLAPLRRYLAGRPSASVLRFSLRLAGLYDQYLVYRPEMVLRWEVGEGKDWQSWLWRRLAPDQPWHWARCVDWLKKNGASLTLKSAPPQVFVFGQSTLSQGFVHSLLAFAEVLPVHFYHWAPTAEYWSDVASPRRRTTGRDKPPEPLQDADLSPLLTSLGQPVKHMADFLQAGDPNEQDCWERPAERSLLGALRREMLYAGAEQESASADGSLLIQRCTSRRREVEVCIDTLSALFADTDLAPDDVLVLCPQLDQYLPSFRALLGTPGEAPMWAWRVLGAAGAAGRDALGALEAVIRLLRFPPLNRSCLETLRYPSVARRFGLGEADHHHLVRWVRQSGLFVSEPAGKFSWNAALDRLVTSVTAGPSEQPGQAAADVHHGEAEALGRLYLYLDSLRQQALRARGEKPLSSWLGWLRQTEAGLLAAEEDDRGPLRDLYRDLAAVAEVEDLALDFEAFSELASQLGQRVRRPGGRAGGMTVATPAAARLLPARVIYVLGVTDGEFPAPQQRSDIDKIARDPRPGDRARRIEDRLVLLEWLCSARDRLILSGVSRDPESGELTAVASVVQELLAHCRDRYGIDETGAQSGALVQVPPLHRFSRRYGKDYRGYADFFNVAAADTVPAIAEVCLPGTEPMHATLPELQFFFRNPTRWFLREVLGVWLDLPEDQLSPSPPLAVNALEQYKLVEDLLASPEDAERRSAEDLEPDVRLPEGSLGQATATRLVDRAASLRDRFAADGGEVFSRVTPFRFPLRRHLLEGELAHADQLRRVITHAGSLSAKHELRLWLEHLVWNVIEADGRSTLVAKDWSLTFRPVAQPESVLSDLVAIMAEGQRRCLPLFPEASKAWVEKGERAALGAWAGSGRMRGDAADVYVARVYGEVCPLGDDFAELARQTWEPLQRHRES